MKKEEIYELATKTWGKEAQMNQAIEECLELGLAIRKQLRNNTEESYMNLIDELADVEIMIEQIFFMYKSLDLFDAVQNRKDYKIRRLESRLKSKS